MSFTTEQIINALRTVNDPDLKKDLVTLNMIRDVRIEGMRVHFTVVLTTPACPLKEVIRQMCVEAIHQQVDKDLQLFIKENEDNVPQADMGKEGDSWQRAIRYLSGEKDVFGYRR